MSLVEVMPMLEAMLVVGIMVIVTTTIITIATIATIAIMQTKVAIPIMPMQMLILMRVTTMPKISTTMPTTIPMNNNNNLQIKNHSPNHKPKITLSPKNRRLIIAKTMRTSQARAKRNQKNLLNKNLLTMNPKSQSQKKKNNSKKIPAKNPKQAVAISHSKSMESTKTSSKAMELICLFLKCSPRKKRMNSLWD